jgi:hypothetical protein
MRMRPSVVVVAAVVGLSMMSARADEKLAGKACRSVHLAYQAPESVAFFNRVTVTDTAEGTYFCVCGFRMGYFGIQEQSRGKKVAIFSVWDPGDQNNPNSVADEQRVKLLAKGDGVRIGRFGNEGTGGQSFLDLDWKTGETYRFLVTAKPDGGDRTAYSAYIAGPEPTTDWRLIASFSTLAKGALLQGHYAFVEDFKRDGDSLQHARRAEYGPGQVQTPDGQWHALDRAKFTADSNPATNIDSGVVGPRFFLATGGKTENTGTKLREELPRPERVSEAPPQVPAP